MKSSHSQPDISIVIPAYTEERRIGKTLDELAEFITNNKTMGALSVEVVVVSADSNDATHDIVREKQKLFKQFVFLRPGPKVGKGRDVQYGMLRAKGKAIIFMDADLATPVRHIPKFYKAYLRGADIIIGVRNIRKHHPSVLRRVVSNAGNLLFRMAGGVWIEDSQCGFKMFTHEAAQLCFSRLTILGWGFDMEVLAIAKTHRLSIQSFRINDWVSVENGTFVDGVLKNSLHSLLELAVIASHRMRGTYKRSLAD